MIRLVCIVVLLLGLGVIGGGVYSWDYAINKGDWVGMTVSALLVGAGIFCAVVAGRKLMKLEGRP